MLKTGYSRGVQRKLSPKLPILSKMPSKNFPVRDHSQSSKILESYTSCLVPVDPLIQITSGGRISLDHWRLPQHLISNTMTTSAELSDISLKRTVLESSDAIISPKNKSNLEKIPINVGSEGSECVPSWLKTGSSILEPSTRRLEPISQKAALTKNKLFAKWLEMDLCSLEVEDLKRCLSMLRFIEDEPQCNNCHQMLFKAIHEGSPYICCRCSVYWY